MKPVEITLRETLPAVPRAARVLLSLLSRLHYGRLEFVTPDGNRFVGDGQRLCFGLDLCGQAWGTHMRGRLLQSWYRITGLVVYATPVSPNGQNRSNTDRGDTGCQQNACLSRSRFASGLDREISLVGSM